VLDASFARQAQRLAVIQTGQASGATTRFIEAVCPEEVALARLARRWRQRIAQGTTPRAPDAPDAPDAQASDGRPELYAAQASAWEPYDAARESAASHLRFDTTSSTSILRERVLEALGAPSAVCWLDAPGVEAELSSQVASEA
jgi:predicted kinase